MTMSISAGAEKGIRRDRAVVHEAAKWDPSEEYIKGKEKEGVKRNRVG